MGSFVHYLFFVFMSCINQWSDVLAQTDTSLFCASREQAVNEAEVIVLYPVVLSNLGGDYSIVTSTYTVPSNGDYVYIYGAGTMSFSKTKVSLRSGLTSHNNIFCDTPTYDGYTTFSRTQVVSSASQDKIYNHMDPGTKLYSSPGLEAYLGGFQLSALMTSVVGFNAAMTNDVDSQGTIQFDVINYDNTGSYNQVTGGYTLPHTGYYYISVTTAMPANTAATVSINNNIMGDLFEVVSTATNNDGVIMGSNGMMFTLPGGSSVTLKLKSGSLYSDDMQQVSMNIFEYDPNSSQAVVWSVYTPADTTASGDINPFPYPEANVNTMGGYSFTNFKVTIVVAGYYFIHINAGTVADLTTDMQLFAGSWSWVAGVGQDTTVCDGQLTSGRDIILPLEIDDEVYVKLVDKTGESSNQFKLTSFTGFLLYAT